jgi:hypothetical protein
MQDITDMHKMMKENTNYMKDMNEDMKTIYKEHLINKVYMLILFVERE